MLNRLDLRGVADPREVLPRPEMGGDAPLAAVQEILARVRSEGDAVLLELTERFDGVALESVRVPPEQVAAALEAVPAELREALEEAALAIEDFHRHQLRADHTYRRGGVRIDGRFVPVDRAGLYVPGGRAAYPSTVLMTAVPARVAGVGELALCVPPDRATGAIPAATLAAAAVAGVDEVYAVGGAQAIGAMAYGTETIRAVDVIAGPGNLYVALAKQEVAGVVGVAAAFAGPSEIVVVADSTAPVDLVAIDVMVQAEHGPDGLAWCITWDEGVADEVDAAVARLTDRAARREDISATLASNGWLAVVDGPAQAIEVANLIAPEHLELICDGAESLAREVRHAGAVFTGPWAPASVGDYIAGPSHVLPTHGSARFGSALTVDDFQKQVHVVHIDEAGLLEVADAVETLAATEGLEAHADSVRMRRAALSGTSGGGTPEGATSSGGDGSATSGQGS